MTGPNIILKDYALPILLVELGDGLPFASMFVNDAARRATAESLTVVMTNDFSVLRNGDSMSVKDELEYKIETPSFKAIDRPMRNINSVRALVGAVVRDRAMMNAMCGGVRGYEPRLEHFLTIFEELPFICWTRGMKYLVHIVAPAMLAAEQAGEFGFPTPEALVAAMKLWFDAVLLTWGMVENRIRYDLGQPTLRDVVAQGDQDRPVHVECTVVPPAPTVRCTATCVAQGSPDYPFHRDRILTAILAASDSPRDFRLRVKMRNPSWLGTPLVKVFLRDCEKHVGHFGQCRTFARSLMRPRAVEAQGLVDGIKMLAINDKVALAIFDVVVFIYSLTKTEDVASKIVQTRFFFASPSGVMVLERFATIVEDFPSVFPGSEPGDVEAQAGFQDVTKGLKAISGFPSTPFYQGVFGIIASLVGAELFGFGSKAFVAKEILSKVKMDPLWGFWPNVEKLFSVISRAVEQRDIWVLFASDNPVVWTNKAISLMGESMDLLQFGVPPRKERHVQRGDAEFWLERLREHFSQAASLKESAPDYARTYLALVSRISELNAIVTANEEQVQPPLVVLYGPPGCGKSLILSDLVNLNVIQDFPDLDVDAVRKVGLANTYRRSNDPKQKYSQGYSTQAYFVFEDIHGAKVENTFPSSVTELVNVYKTRLTMASIEDKARVVAQAKCVFATTNRPFIDVPEYDMVQVARRVSYVVHVTMTPATEKYLVSINANLEDGPYKVPHWPYQVGEECHDLRSNECSKLPFDVWVGKGFPPELHPDRICTWTILDGATVVGNRLHFDTGKKVREFNSRAEFLVFHATYYRDFRESGLTNLARMTSKICEFGFPETAHRSGVVLHDKPCRCRPGVEAQGWAETFEKLESFCVRHQRVTKYLLVGTTAGFIVNGVVNKVRDVANTIPSILGDIFLGMTRRLVDRIYDAVFGVYELALSVPSRLVDSCLHGVRRVTMIKLSKNLRAKLEMVYMALTLCGSMFVAYRIYAVPKQVAETSAEGAIKEDVLQKLRDPKLQALEFQRRSGTKPELVEAVNPWHSPYIKLNVGPAVVGRTIEQMTNAISNNTHEVRIMGENIRVARRAFAVKMTATTFAFPRHLAIFKGGLDACLVMRLGKGVGVVGYNTSVMLDFAEEGNARDAPELDLVFVEVALSPGRGIYEYFSEEIGATAEMWREGEKVGIANLSSVCTMTVRDPEGGVISTEKLVEFKSAPLEGGACGLAYYGELRGTIWIFGIHIASTEGTVLVNCLSKNSLTKYVNLKEKAPAISASAQAYLATIEFDPTPPNAIVTTMPGFPGDVIGTIKGELGRKDVSRVRKTLLYPHFHHLASKEYSQPYLGGGKMAGEDYVSPFFHKFLCTVDACAGPASLLRDGAREYMKRVKPAKCVVFDDYDMFAGTGEAFCGPVVLKTSMGPPWTKIGCSPKTKLIVRGKDEIEVDLDLALALAAVERQLLEGPVYILTELTLKDEVVSAKKFEEANTRLFSVVSGDINLIGRKYLLPLMREFYKQREASGMMPGINSYGIEWDKLFKRLDQYDGLFGCDQRKFDAHHLAEMFGVVAAEMFEFALKCGYTVDEATICKHLILSCAYQIVILKNDMFLVHLGLGSGLWITTFFNCFVNSILIITCLKKRLGYVPKFDFATFGDDLLVGLDRAIGYTQKMLAEDMSLFGYEITAANKDEELQDYDDLATASFLKRGFVFHERLGRVVAPIERDSIYRMLCWRMKSEISDIERCPIVCDTALMEACLHGREFFDELRGRLMVAMGELEIPWEAKSWEALCGDLEVDDPVVAVLAQGAPCEASPVGSRHMPGNPLKVVSYTDVKFSQYDNGRNSLEIKRDERGNMVPESGRARKDQKIMSSTEINTNIPYTPPETIVGNIEMQMDLDESSGVSSSGVPKMVVENSQLGISDVLGRPIRVQTWTVTDAVAPSGWNFFHAWLAQALPQRYLTPYVYLRGTFKMRFDVSGTPFQYGNFMFWAYAQPPKDLVSFGTDSRVLFDGGKPYQPYQVSNVKIDLSAVGSYELSVPLVSPTGWINLRSSIQETGSIVWAGYQAVTPLQTVSPPFRPFNVNVYCWMEDVEVSVSAQSERDAMGANKGLGSIVDKFRKLSTSYAGPLSTAMELLDKVPRPVSQAMGFSKPLVVDQVGAVVARANTDFAATESARFFGYRSGTDPLGGVAIPPGAAGFVGADETRISSLCQRNGLLGVYQWVPTALTGTVLTTVFVNPCTVPYTDNSYWTTPLSMTAAPFLFWGGGLKYKLTVWASPFHKGTLRLIHSPLGAAASSDTSRVESKIVEVCGKTEFEFCADWKKPVPFIPVSDSIGIKPMDVQLVTTFKALTGQTYNGNINNGSLIILVEAPLVSSNSTVPPVYFTLEVAGCPDFRVARPNITNVNSYKAVQGPMWKSAALVSTMPDLVAENEGETYAQSGEDVPYRISFGEVVADIKEVTKILVPAVTYSPIGPSTPANSLAATEFCVPAYPWIPSTTSGSTNGPFAVVVDATSSVCYTGFTYASWFETMFWAQRGGYRVAIQSFAKSKAWLTAGEAWANPGSQYRAWNMGTAAGTYGTGYSLFEGVNSDLTTPLATVGAGLYEMELPSVNPGFFRNAQASTFWTPGMVPGLRGPVLAIRQAAYNELGIETEAALPPITVWSGTADDYSLAGFAFTPQLKVIS